MSKQSSYEIKTVASNVDLEINRLKAQVELFWEKELKHYVEFGLRDGMSIVELGSGPGFLTEKILQEFPNVYVTAVEIDPLLVDYASNYLSQKHLHRFVVYEKCIKETGLMENSFDYAIIRLVLEHLPDPINAVCEVIRILKPGGKAVFINNDFISE